MGSLGMGELFVVFVVAIIVWGDKFPAMARKAARFYGQLRNYMFQFRDEVMRHVPDEREIMADPNPLPPGDQMPTYMDPSDPDYKPLADTAQQTANSEQKSDESTQQTGDSTQAPAPESTTPPDQAATQPIAPPEAAPQPAEQKRQSRTTVRRKAEVTKRRKKSR